MPQISPSNESTAPVWLAEQVYLPKRQRTIDLVHQSVEALRREKARISLASIAHELRNEVVEELISRLVGGSCTERDGVLRSGSRSRGMESEKGRK